MGSAVSLVTTVPWSSCRTARSALFTSSGVPEERAELSWGCPRRILSPLRLPFRHSGFGGGNIVGAQHAAPLHQIFDSRSRCESSPDGFAQLFAAAQERRLAH